MPGRRSSLGLALLMAWLGSSAIASGAEETTLQISVEPREATIGEQLQTVLTLSRPSDPDDAPIELPTIGPQLGPFTVNQGTWEGPSPGDGLTRWVWRGTLSAFRVGALELPPIRITLNGPNGATELATEPLTVTIVSVLGPEEPTDGTAEPSDLKPPASIAPNFTPVWAAAAILGGLLVICFVLLWLYRRHAALLAAAEIPDDPFHRTPPHVWVYSELQRLLERRLPEQGQVELFYVELSRILKRYLGGRYRVDLLEHTTAELPALLQSAGAPADSTATVVDVLNGADRVKFANVEAGPTEWKTAVEEVYRVVDLTKPVEQPEATGEAGAA